MRARIRTVKPEVLSDEELWDAEQRSGLPLFRAYVGLWCYSDREGRFEWRPRALRAALLPYWDGDIEDVLAALAEARFVVRYEVDGKLYGHVRTFAKHQVVNKREAQSVLPSPPVTVTPVHARALQGSAHGEGKGRDLEGNGKGREGEGNTADQPPPPDPSRDMPMPLDFEPHPAAFAEVTAWAKVSPAVVEKLTEEFKSYWTIGAGAGKPRAHWQAKWREEVRRKKNSGRLDEMAAELAKETGTPAPVDAARAERARKASEALIADAKANMVKRHAAMGVKS